MQQYIDLLRKVLDGATIKTVQGVRAHSVFGAQTTFDISGYKFPLVTIRDSHPRYAIEELLWAIRGETTVDTLLAKGITRWNNRIIPGTAIYDELTLIERLHTAEGIAYQESHNPERFFSVEEKPDHELVEIYGLWRPIGLTTRLHQELDALGVPRRALVGGDLAIAPGEHWRKRPDETTEAPLRYKQAERYLKASGSLNEVTERFEAQFGPGSLDLWLLTSTGEQRLDATVKEDEFIHEQLASLGYPVTERVTTKAFDQLGQALAILRSNPDHRQPSVYVRYEDDIESLFQFYSRKLTQQELVSCIQRSNLVRKADLELFNSYDPIDRERYLTLDETVIRNWVVDNNLPVRGLQCHLYQNTVDLYTDLPLTIAIYTLLVKMVAQCVGMEPLSLTWTGADCFIPAHFVNAVSEEICKPPLSEPSVLINRDITDLESFTLADFTLIDYQHH